MNKKREKIVAEREKAPIKTTIQLAEIGCFSVYQRFFKGKRLCSELQRDCFRASLLGFGRLLHLQKLERQRSYKLS